ncbi:MAG: YpdA family putative bacillithiol disulfide reductase [Bacteroidetes bacterium SW_11_45_7]|nr:MAG: YpdA family putative bacillithiol disulfide reductase [Bacteroidetes bacterium SW_11_45_7]
MTQYDVVIVGGGPVGLACGIEAKKAGLSHLIIEKGAITDAVRRYPLNMEFFSTTDKISIGNLPFTITNMRPSREQALQYYRTTVDHYQLNMQLFTEVSNIDKEDDTFTVATKKGEEYSADRVIIATGYFDHPNKLGIPGEELPHVSHYFDDPFKYSQTKVVVVGGSNSAVDTALDLYRHGADVTLVHRKDHFSDSVKYWILPDIRNRIKEESIGARMNTVIEKMDGHDVHLLCLDDHRRETLQADFVLLMTGYHADPSFLKQAGINVEEETLMPYCDEDTYETNIPGLYVAGSVIAGKIIKSIFIENGREHAKMIVDDIASKKEAVKEVRKDVSPDQC